MGNEVIIKAVSMPIQDVSALAQAVAKSKLWGAFNSPDQIMGLMLLCQAEGLHPMDAVRQYDLIQGKPAMKSEAQLAKFYARGGRVKWLKRDATECEAVFIHPQNCPDGVPVKWTLDDAKKAGLISKDNWVKFPRQMLSARVQAEGVQIADPGAALGINNVEEQTDLNSQIAETAAQISSRLTGDEASPNPEPPPVIEDKDYRKLRAELNKALQACKTQVELRAACMEFQKKNSGKGIWLELTRHNAMETFEMLATEHQNRVIEDDFRRSPEGLEKWRDDLAKCDPSRFAQFQDAYKTLEYLQTHENLEAIEARGRELGLEEYADNEIHGLSN